MGIPWIKVEKTTPNKPELRYIGRECSVSKGDAFLAWFLLWRYFDAHVDETGFLRFLGPEDCDDIAKVDGIGKALEEAGWLAFDETGVTIRNWTKHNGKSAKQRALGARRVARHRQKK